MRSTTRYAAAMIVLWRKGEGCVVVFLCNEGQGSGYLGKPEVLTILGATLCEKDKTIQ